MLDINAKAIGGRVLKPKPKPKPNTSPTDEIAFDYSTHVSSAVYFSNASVGDQFGFAISCSERGHAVIGSPFERFGEGAAHVVTPKWYKGSHYLRQTIGSKELHFEKHGIC